MVADQNGEAVAGRDVPRQRRVDDGIGSADRLLQLRHGTRRLASPGICLPVELDRQEVDHVAGDHELDGFVGPCATWQAVDEAGEFQRKGHHGRCISAEMEVGDHEDACRALHGAERINPAKAATGFGGGYLEQPFRWAE